MRHFYGSNISGEALDYQDGKVLAGCYAPMEQLHVWDFGKGVKI
jgi:hypothetical protein